MNLRMMKSGVMKSTLAAGVAVGLASPAMAVETLLTLDGVPFWVNDDMPIFNTYEGDGIAADNGYAGGEVSANAEVAAFSAVVGHNYSLATTSAALADGLDVGETTINLPQAIPTAGLAGAGIPAGNSFLGTTGVFEFGVVNNGGSAPVPAELTGVITNLIPVNVLDNSLRPVTVPGSNLVDNGLAPGSVAGDGIPDQLITPAGPPIVIPNGFRVEFGLGNPLGAAPPPGFTGASTAPIFEVYADIPVTGDLDTGTGTTDITEDDLHFGNDGLPVPGVLDPGASADALAATDGTLWLRAEIATATATFKFFESSVLGSGTSPIGPPPDSNDVLIYEVTFTAAGEIIDGAVNDFDESDDALTSKNITLSATLYGEVRTSDVNPMGLDLGLITAGNTAASMADFTTGLFGNSGDASFTIQFNPLIPEPITAGLGIMALTGLGAAATRRRKA